MFYQEEPGLTYDDVLLMPLYSEILPHEVKLHTRFTKNINLNIPLASSAMDTVTESKTAITMAQEGGIGVIHKNLSIKRQAHEVMVVKKFEAGMVIEPICVSPEHTLSDIRNFKERHGFSAYPVVNSNQELVGIITNRDTRYETDPTKTVEQMMTSKENLVLGEDGIDIEDAKKLLHFHRIEKLPIITSEGKLVGMITIKDIEKSIAHPNANKDKLGRLRVAAAVGASDKELERAKALIDAGVDAVVIDTAHGHSKGVVEMLKKVKALNADVDVIAGNVATEAACELLIKNGADAIKIGIGPGSICTTRVVAGIGVPQLQALLDCKKVCEKHNIPFTGICFRIPQVHIRSDIPELQYHHLTEKYIWLEDTDAENILSKT